MTRRRFAIALAVPVLVFVPLFAQTTKSVWTGVYTTEQATRGTDLYQRVCGECHGDDLEGRERSRPPSPAARSPSAGTAQR